MRAKKITIAIFVITVMTIIIMILPEFNLKYIIAEFVYNRENTIESEIIFSKKTGFYDEEFYLNIYAPHEEIYYTLDGSEPTKESYKYEGPILIYDASENENTNSMRTDVSSWFVYAEDYGCTVPDYLIDKCTIIKAAYFDENGQKSKSEERVYFVDFAQKMGYKDTNIISITVEPEELFGSERGIYVLGNTFEKYAKEVDYDNIPDYVWEANFRNKGRDWEKIANIHVFDKELNLVLSQSVGLRIQGGASRSFNPKSLNLYARDEYGNNQLQYDFWGTGYYPQRVTLSSGGNDYFGKMKDRIGAELTSECGFATMHYEPYVLFLNGEYWGFYYLTEKYDEHYIEHYYNVDKDNVIMIKNNQLEVGNEADFSEYEEMRSFIESADMTVYENYYKACLLLDMEAYIEYFAAEIYMARNGDWPNGNDALWRSRKVSHQPYEDGKWRYMLFDVNSSAFSNDLIEHDTLNQVIRESAMFRNLSQNNEFRKKFADELLEMRDVYFEEQLVLGRLEEYRELMSEPMENHLQRFFSVDNGRYHRRVKRMIEFGTLRGDYIDTMLRNNGFGE